jgi:uncharacterized protein YuzE
MGNAMRLTYDLNVGALYIKLSDQTVARTRDLDDNTSVDLDDAGGVVGIEVISYAHPWAFWQILETCQLPAAEEAQLRATFPVWDPAVTDNGRTSSPVAANASPAGDLAGPKFSVRPPAPRLVEVAA